MDELSNYIRVRDCRQGMIDIKLHFNNMLQHQKLSCENKSITYINTWRDGFQSHHFLGNERCFLSDNLRELFKLTYEHKCSNSMKPLLDIYQEVITLRVMYLHVNRVFHEDKSGLETKLAEADLEKFFECMYSIETAMKLICPFFNAVRTLKEKKSAFDTSKFYYI